MNKLFFLFFIYSCNVYKDTLSTNNYYAKVNFPIIVYKTKFDYNNFVPVILSDNRLQIVSYPDPGDLYVNSKFLMPTKLHNGFLLDNKGINKNVAFINITYNDYSKLFPLSLNQMRAAIISVEPLEAFFDCSCMQRDENLITRLNTLIDKNLLVDSCKKL